MEFALADEIIGDLRRVQLAVADQHATISFLSRVQRLRELPTRSPQGCRN